MGDNAISELEEFLNDGEFVEAVVFGAWGWGGYGEPDPPPVPVDRQGVVLSFDEAKQYMGSWCFYGGYGAPDCYAVNIWTNQRIIWVTQYDGATGLDSAPRNPVATIPDMPGG